MQNIPLVQMQQILPTHALYLAHSSHVLPAQLHLKLMLPLDQNLILFTRIIEAEHMTSFLFFSSKGN